MGRQERPLDPGGGPLAFFAQDLRRLRRAAGSPSYQRLAARTHFAASTLAAAAAGRKLPSAAVLAAYVEACGGDVAEWEARRRALWASLAESPTADAHPTASPAGPPPVASEPPATATTPATPTSTATDPGTAHPAATATVRTGTGAAQSPVTPRHPASSHRPPARRDGRGRSPLRGRRPLWRCAGIGLTCLLLATTSAASPPRSDAANAAATEVWFSPDADIPQRYRPAIVAAGTSCAAPQVSPALVAAILKAESDFDPHLSDPAKDEYGIARWTPRVLRYYLPEEQQKRVPEPPLAPEMSIAALGRMLCTLAPQLEGVAGDPVLNLAAAYRTATWIVQKENGIPARVRPYTDRVRVHLMRYAPEDGACLPYAAAASSYPAPCDQSRLS
ncbi:helix-turn-helix domain-containing protein [Streptomyces sp. NPDC051315]|uniref:helix-turn-helix domain-containing protein n=1 Tax=Streptomyces sp. NPDC051315 TaxID=3365650 RepID=UPI00379F2266